MNLYDLLEQKFGIKTIDRINPETDTVGTSPVRVLLNNPNRVAAIIINLSANSLYVLPDEAVTTTRGIFVGGNGGRISIIYDEDFHLVGRDWFAVASGAGSQILVLEVTTV